MTTKFPSSALEQECLHFQDIGIYLCDLDLDSKRLKKEESVESGDAKKSQEPKEILEKLKKKRENHPAKSFGRWRYRQHYIYMQIVRRNLGHKDLIKALEHELPGRTVSQIRAHHQKMLYKFKGVGNLIKAYPDSTMNFQFIEMCNILDLALEKIEKIRGTLDSLLEKNCFGKREL